MEIPKKYNPSETESKWYDYWMEHKMFESTPDDREAYTIVIPPPNVTGVLHMGHMLNNTIQDVLIRKARMEGKNACWVPGTDHASIATESKVVAKLAKEGISKDSLSREDFLKHAFEWKDEYGGIILGQLQKLGASCDWSRTNFTMDETYSKDVIATFVDLFNKGKIYRGYRMINWDPKAKTALSDEEVIHTEEQSMLYHVSYKIEGTEDVLVIATTRPETILGDSAICVNPNDERYQHLKGKRAIVPMVNRSIPIIFDDYVDVEFGTGCLKVTPAHDTNDYELGKKHDLEIIDILNDDGSLSEAAQFYIGEDRFEVRKKIAKDLEKSGHLIKSESYVNKVGRSERTNAVIEPKLSMQWYCSMKEMAAPALSNVMDDTIRFYPENSKNTYRHWMDNIRDWCISRQLWWGHRIPAYYYGPATEDFVVANTAEEALEMAKAKTGNTALQLSDLKQDEDVLDTWFSSWLWPISVFTEEEQQYYYPTETIVTGPDIMFFWIARMIMAGYEYKNEAPFKHVYYTGLIRDKQGRKMSKSLGNSPDALKLIDRYGADGVRSGLLLTSAAGNDLKFQSEKGTNGETTYPQCEQGRNFGTKLWSALNLVKMWSVDESLEQPTSSKVAVEWFKANLNQKINEINSNFERYRISDALMGVYKLVWDDFCSAYLEMIKPAYQQPIDAKTLKATIELFEEQLQLLHPFMPFITEEIWQLLGEREEASSIMFSKWPVASEVDTTILEQYDLAAETIQNIRKIRKEKNIAHKVALQLVINEHVSIDKTFDTIIRKMTNLESVSYGKEEVQGAFSFRVKANEFYIPVAAGGVDVSEEIARLEKELKHQQGFLTGVMKKLSNERFVSSAPEKVVAIERKKQSDAVAKISTIQKQLAGLK